MKYILTFDYELFGSGKGDVINDLVSPTYKILTILDSLEIKAVFFIEQLEIDAIINLKHKFPTNSKEYSDAVALENQIALIVERGHDIQLHLHPQWYGAVYENNNWILNFKWWRFSALPYRSSHDGTPGKYDLILLGKESLERRIKKINPNYTCHSFRAGGYNIGADKSSVDALINNNFKVDSSICPGYFSNSTLSNYDYTSVSCDLGNWESKDSLYASLKVPKNQHCLELPLITIRSNFFEKLSLSRIYSSIKNRKKKAIHYAAHTTTKKPSYPVNLKNTNYDVCLSSNIQIKRLNQAIKARSIEEKSSIVLIGHPKDYSFFSPMKKIITSLKENNNFTTLEQFVREEI